LEPAWDHETLKAWFSARPGQDVSETDLLKAFFPGEELPGVGLALFQKHFLLYRRLWLFDDELRVTTGHRLWIRGIRSTLIDPPPPGRCGWLDLETGRYCAAAGKLCPRHDQKFPEQNSMKSYYLNWKNLEGMTEEGLKELVDGFFRRMVDQKAVTAALETFGLPPDAAAKAVKARWRRLSLDHHPDRGGDPAAFRKFSDAWSVLKAWISS
jgi:hypothetical protein